MPKGDGLGFISKVPVVIGWSWYWAWLFFSLTCILWLYDVVSLVQIYMIRVMELHRLYIYIIYFMYVLYIQMYVVHAELQSQTYLSIYLPIYLSIYLSIYFVLNRGWVVIGSDWFAQFRTCRTMLISSGSCVATWSTRCITRWRYRDGRIEHFEGIMHAWKYMILYIILYYLIF